ncbi:hypothetical protein [Glycomyces sp. NPDC048151]|uniref:hypothetical protein n=1 Tax=Glycomyces sp. NPDC048151 TaxID=3364002 RepID=UPI0037208BBB
MTLMEEGHTNPLEAIDADTLRRLELRAESHSRSIQSEAAVILTSVLESDEAPIDDSAWEMFRKLREQFGTVDEFEIPPREGSPARAAVFFE